MHDILWRYRGADPPGGDALRPNRQSIRTVQWNKVSGRLKVYASDGEWIQIALDRHKLQVMDDGNNLPCVDANVWNGQIDIKSLFFNASEHCDRSFLKGSGDVMLRVFDAIATFGVPFSAIRLEDGSYLRFTDPTGGMFVSSERIAQLTAYLSVTRGYGYYQHRGFVNEALFKGEHPSMAQTITAVDMALKWIHYVVSTPIVTLAFQDYELGYGDGTFTELPHLDETRDATDRTKRFYSDAHATDWAAHVSFYARLVIMSLLKVYGVGTCEGFALSDGTKTPWTHMTLRQMVAELSRPSAFRSWLESRGESQWNHTIGLLGSFACDALAFSARLDDNDVVQLPGDRLSKRFFRAEDGTPTHVVVVQGSGGGPPTARAERLALDDLTVEFAGAA